MNSMTGRGTGLLAEIRSEALDPGSDVASTLRKCVALGGESGSERLREWALRELKGYDPGDDVPEYRMVTAPIAVDWRSVAWQAQGEVISSSTLPEIARDHIKELMKVDFSVSQMQSILERKVEAGESTVAIAPPIAADVVNYMNSVKPDNGQFITRLYWMLDMSNLDSILGSIRTGLVEMVTDLERNGSLKSDTDLRPEVVDRAFGIAFHGDIEELNIGAVVQGGGIATEPQVNLNKGSDSSPLRKLAWWTFGLATLAAAVFGILGLTVF